MVTLRRMRLLPPLPWFDATAAAASLVASSAPAEAWLGTFAERALRPTEVPPMTDLCMVSTVGVTTSLFT